MHWQAKHTEDSREPGDAGRGEEGTLPKATGENTVLLTPWFQISSLRTVSQWISVLLRHLVRDSLRGAWQNKYTFHQTRWSVRSFERWLLIVSLSLHTMVQRSPCRGTRTTKLINLQGPLPYEAHSKGMGGSPALCSHDCKFLLNFFAWYCSHSKWRVPSFSSALESGDFAVAGNFLASC